MYDPKRLQRAAQMVGSRCGLGVISAFVMACSAPGPSASETNYSAAFIRNSTLVVFPFEGKEFAIDLPSTIDSSSFSADGRLVYGTIDPLIASRRLVAVGIQPSSVTSLPGTGEFTSINGMAVDALGESWSNLSVSRDGSRLVGTAQKGQLGIVDLTHGRIERLWPGTEAYWSPGVSVTLALCIRWML